MLTIHEIAGINASAVGCSLQVISAGVIMEVLL